ncbi:TPA: HAMP domain-containing histidine kinase [Streptococcus suis]|nr:HAMP domain-containing histidine kinase [Streptococcus suis]HEM5331426.1 HAMP domain-containing histidine kinase [Streptococcus suis]HEM5335387.1 HAMP domain-containing histidine kinase [Streptococcus suis]
MKLARRQFIIVTSLISVTSLILVALLYFAMPIYYNQQRRQELRDNFNTVMINLDGQSNEDILTNIEKYDLNRPDLLYSLFDSNGERLWPREELITDDQGRHPNYKNLSSYDEVGSWSTTLVSKENSTYILMAEYGFTGLSQVSQSLLTLYPFVMILIVILALIVGAIYSKLSTRRIALISETARKMQSLESGIECQVIGQDEISVLAQDVNRLYSKLLMSIEELRMETKQAQNREREKSEFLRMTSHELKTPIASMMGLVEGMIYNVGEFKNHDLYLKKCRTILQNQSELVHSILDATNMEISTRNQEEIFQLDEVLQESMASYNALAIVNQYQFSTIFSPTAIKGDRVLLMKALKNIIDNAFRYSRSGGEINLICKQGTFIVDNEVAHILPEEEIEKLFLPFYRPDYSRAKQDGGTGIGLYLVKQVLDKHGFNYSFTVVGDSTMRFRIDFDL